MLKSKHFAQLNESISQFKATALIACIFSCLGKKNTSNSAKVKEVLRKNFPNVYSTQAEVDSVVNMLLKDKLLTGTLENFSDPRGASGSSFPQVFVEVVSLKGESAPTSSRSTVTKAAAKPVQSIESIKGNKISRSLAQKLMENNSGKFFSAKFVTKKNKMRTINAQLLKDSSVELGYIKVKEINKIKKGENAVRNINLQTLEELSIGGRTFQVG